MDRKITDNSTDFMDLLGLDQMPMGIFFSMPFDLFEAMIDRHEESFLSKKNWTTVKKKIGKSRDVWSK